MTLNKAFESSPSESAESSKPESQNFSIASISYNEFSKILESVEAGKTYVIDLEEDTWVETDGSKPILNYAAGPCLIIYAQVGDRLLAGHFTQTETSKDNSLIDHLVSEDKDNEYLVIPEEHQVLWLTAHTRYTSMISRIKELQEETSDVKVFLSGQNVSEDNSTSGKVHTIMQRFNIDQDLKAIGVNATSIEDNRASQASGIDEGDNTVYLPETKTIYWHHGSPN